MTYFSEMLLKALELAGVKAYSLAKQAGLNEKFIYKITNGDRRPTNNVLMKLAKTEAFLKIGITIEQLRLWRDIDDARQLSIECDDNDSMLVGLEDNVIQGLAKIEEETGLTRTQNLHLALERHSEKVLAPAELPKTLVPFPCKGTVAASGLCYTEEPPETYYFQFADPRVYDTNMFCLKIQGDSMAPDYKDGGLLLVRPTTTFKNGKPYIVQTENHETTFKIVQVSPNGTMLIPINKRHKPFSVDSHRIVKLFEIIQYRWEP